MGQGCDEHWILDMRKRVTIGLKKKKKGNFRFLFKQPA